MVKGVATLKGRRLSLLLFLLLLLFCGVAAVRAAKRAEPAARLVCVIGHVFAELTGLGVAESRRVCRSEIV